MGVGTNNFSTLSVRQANELGLKGIFTFDSLNAFL